MAEVSLVVQSGAVNADRVLNEDSGDFEICAVLTGDIDQDVITRLVITSGSGSSGARCEMITNSWCWLSFALTHICTHTHTCK